MAIPVKKAMVVYQYPFSGPRSWMSASLAFEKISINDTYIMTPALNPSAADRNLGFTFLYRNAIILPIPVNSPANRVNRKANSIASDSMEGYRGYCL